ncbi:MAG: nucleotide sugar dehydrogenase [Candidatus Bathyarchaeia archaeon]
MSSALNLTPGQVAKSLRGGELTVAVIGCGVMGLPNACLIANAGANVIGVDASPAVAEAIRHGRTGLPEPGLDALLRREVRAKRLAASTDPTEASRQADIINIAVPTVIDANKRPDYSWLRKASEQVGKGIRPGVLVVSSSTVAPGITEEVVGKTVEKLSGMRFGRELGLAFSPFRASAGSILRDMVTYPRVVGAVDERSLGLASAFLESFTKGGVVKVRDIKTAELSKLLENTYRFVNVVLSGELAVLAERLGIDYDEAQRAATSQPYCHLLLPGIGAGGHIPKDQYLLTSVADEYSTKLRLARQASVANDELVAHNIRLIVEAASATGRAVRRSRIAFLGISFKPNVKELRGSRCVDVVKALRKKGAEVVVYDPYFEADELRKAGLDAANKLERAIEGANCVVVGVAHEEYKSLTLRFIASHCRKPAAIVDFGHIFNPAEVEREGFIYRAAGRGVWTK